MSAKIEIISEIGRQKWDNLTSSQQNEKIKIKTRSKKDRQDLKLINNYYSGYLI